MHAALFLYSTIQNLHFFRPGQFLRSMSISVALATAIFLSGQTPWFSMALAKGSSTTAPVMQKPLHPESQMLYHYLVLTDAFNTNDKAAIQQSMKKLLALDASKDLFHYACTTLFNMQNYKDLITFTSLGVKKYPQDRLLALLLATGYIEVDQMPKALDVLETHLRNSTAASIANTDLPDYDSVIKELFRLYSLHNDEKRATAFLPVLTKERAPKNPVLHARILLFIGQAAKAQTVLAQVASDDPDNVDIWLELGDLAEKQNNTPKAIQCYTKALALQPSSINLLMRLAELTVQTRGDLTVLARSTGIPPSLTLQLALFASEKSRGEEALRLIEYAKKQQVHPDDAAITTAGVYINAFNDINKAVQSLETIKKGSPFYAEALERQVRLLLWSKKGLEGLLLVQKAREEFPADVAFVTLHAQALTELNKPEEGIKILNQALSIFKNNASLRYTMGLIQDRKGDKKAALATMEQLILDTPQHADALNYIGYVLIEENRDLERAVALIYRALAEQPNSFHIIDSLAWGYYRMGNYQEAWEHIQRCVQLGEAESVIWEHYGDIALKLKLVEKAREGYTQALNANPENPDELKKKLRSLPK